MGLSEITSQSQLWGLSKQYNQSDSVRESKRVEQSMREGDNKSNYAKPTDDNFTTSHSIGHAPITTQYCKSPNVLKPASLEPCSVFSQFICQFSQLENDNLMVTTLNLTLREFYDSLDININSMKSLMLDDRNRIIDKIQETIDAFLSISVRVDDSVKDEVFILPHIVPIFEKMKEKFIQPDQISDRELSQIYSTILIQLEVAKHCVGSLLNQVVTSSQDNVENDPFPLISQSDALFFTVAQGSADFERSQTNTITFSTIQQPNTSEYIFIKPTTTSKSSLEQIPNAISKAESQGTSSSTINNNFDYYSQNNMKNAFIYDIEDIIPVPGPNIESMTDNEVRNVAKEYGLKSDDYDSIRLRRLLKAIINKSVSSQR